jgi:hypothetical protein
MFALQAVAQTSEWTPGKITAIRKLAERGPFNVQGARQPDQRALRARLSRLWCSC